MLDSCPRCGYSLQGLPEDHACPECGLRYDRDSEAYKHRNPKVLFIGLFGFFIGAGCMADLARAFGDVGSFWRVCIIVAWVLYFSAAAWLFRTAYLLYRIGPVVAVMSEGLFMRLPSVNGEWIPWKDISSVEFKTRGHGAALLHLIGRQTLLIDGVFGSSDQSRRFVSQVTARIETARKSTPLV